MSETIAVVNNEAARRFEAWIGDEVAFTEYRLRDGTMILPHTVAPEAFAGKGVGGLLAKAVLSYAREQGLEVVPTCSFIAGYITKHPEWHDLVQAGYRERLGIER
ncbi:GNAT family N-acetyltransferase [Phenylobacterium sp. LjRoot225]|uniref:GNAT family N-acetyltransferase n=1 Tax=Phenylobacterium sp. LjRoot225 TaxID=3342285 RepID=UPI003ECDF520